ncbi:hypothetical protein [Pandoraea pnomenusa]|uniref:hypothetical protein n=1 Tax=Pandoraea pnomenusa TaxID=93220 RepID=UPI003342DBCE
MGQVTSVKIIPNMTAPCGEPAIDVAGCLGMGWHVCYSCPVASQAAEERKS